MKISKKQLLKFEKAARRSASIASGGYDGRFGQRVVESKKQYNQDISHSEYISFADNTNLKVSISLVQACQAHYCSLVGNLTFSSVYAIKSRTKINMSYQCFHCNLERKLLKSTFFC